MTGKAKIVHGWPARSNAAHNPFQTLLSEATESNGWQVREFRPFHSCFLPASVWHWHWPEGQFAHRSRASAWLRLVALTVLLFVARVRRISVIWTAHNISGHIPDNRPVENVFWRIFHKRIQGVHYLSESSRMRAFSTFPLLKQKPYVVTRHGHYKAVYGVPLSKEESRSSFGLDPRRPTIVFCGKVSAYKGVADLISSFTLTSGNDIQLFVAGAASETEEQLVRLSAAKDKRVHLLLKHLTDQEIRRVVSSADLVVLPYREVTNSGSVLLALSLDRPVLSANKGSIPELMSQLPAPWITTYTGVLTPDDLVSALAEAEVVSNGHPDLSPFEWSTISAELCEFYESMRRTIDAK